MIKKIHYCWFGYGEKNELIRKCIESWKKYCPDFEIIEWNEKNFDISSCKYAKEAYKAKKWAFVSDYCRYCVLYKYGGVYLDTDVELIKKIDDLPENFIGFEDDKKVNSGLIRASSKKNKILAEIIASYKNDSFIRKDGTYNLKTVCERETEILKQYGFIENNKLQNIKCLTVFPSDYFSPYNAYTKEMNITKNTRSIHWFNASWYDEKDKYTRSLKIKLSKKMPKAISDRLSVIISTIKYEGIKTLIKKCTYFIKGKK